MRKTSATRHAPRLALLIPLLAGCAGAALQTRPEDIARLEQRAAAAPASNAAVELGRAYFTTGRAADAERVLRAAIDAGATDGSAFLYFGLANEEQEDWTEAKAAYEKYLTTGTDAGMRNEIRARLPLVARGEVKQLAKQALAREQVISQEPPTPNTLAVLPFQITGLSEEMRPLQTALADMMITDLSVTPGVKPVERVRLQALMDEIRLGLAGFSEEVTNRAGRMLKAENMVQGAIVMTGEEQIRIDGSVLLTAQQSNRGTFGGEQNLESIFDLEKQIVFQIYDRLGVSLTPQERERILENRTSNLVAFLAYGRGLDALDRGNYIEAASHLGEATRLDPSFSAARAQRTEAAQLQQAASLEPIEVASAAGAAQTAVPSTMASADLLRNTASQVNYSPADGLMGQGRLSEPSADPGRGAGPAADGGVTVVNTFIEFLILLGR